MAQLVARGIQEHEDGVYLGMAERAYLEDPAIGYTGMKQLKAEPVEWWWGSAYNTISPVNPDLEDDTAATLLGTAAHVAFLDSWEAFTRIYGRVPSIGSHPDALDTVRQLRTWMEARGIGSRGATTKAQLIARIREFDAEVPILEDLVQQFRLSGLIGLTAAQWGTIQLLHAVGTGQGLQLDIPEPMTLRQFFVGGLSEVSVFWTDESGIRQRARFDKLFPNVTGDLKTFGKWGGRNFRSALLREIGIRGYWMQAAHYDEARVQLRRLVAEGRVFGGDVIQRALLDEIAAAETWAWVWVFAKTTGFPHIKAIPAQRDLLMYQNALKDRQEALANFIAYRETFGLEPGKLWLDTEVIWEPQEEEWFGSALASA